MELLVGWQVADALTDFFEALQIDTSVLKFAVQFRILNLLPSLRRPLLFIESIIFALRIRVLIFLVGLCFNGTKLSFSNALLNELLPVHVSDRLLVLDDVIHQRLSERWLIKLVVAHLAVTDQVNDHVSVELLSILSSDFKNTCYVLQRISVNVEDWSLNRLGQVRAVVTRTALIR